MKAKATTHAPRTRGSGPSRPPSHPVRGRTAVLVVSYGSHALLATNLAPLTRARPALICVVVDNPTDLAERAALRRLCAAEGWDLLEPEANAGFGAGVNLAAGRALERGADTLVTLNPDASLAPSDLDHLVAATGPMTLAGPLVVDASGRTTSDGMVCCLADGTMRSRRSTRPVPPGGVQRWLSGACLAVGAPLWRALGGFDEEFFLYWEEVDLAARAEAAGGRLRLVRGARAVHTEGGTQGRGAGDRAKSAGYYFYDVRNRYLYAARHLPASARLRWALTGPAAARRVLLRGGRRQLLASPHPLVAVGRGMVAGLALLVESD